MQATIEGGTTVNSTTDYSIFNIMGSNRLVHQPHLRALAESVGQNPQLLQARPILVNDKFEVIDGQHRLAVASKLGVPIYYIKVDGLEIGHAMELNHNQRNWQPDDYARAWATVGKHVYQLFLDLREETNFGTYTVITYMEDKVVSGGNGSLTFRRGNLHMRGDLSDVKERLSKFQDVVDAMSSLKFSKNGLAAGVLTLMHHPDYNHAHFIHKVEMFAVKYAMSGRNLQENLRMLENIYNHNTMADKQIKLY